MLCRRITQAARLTAVDSEVRISSLYPTKWQELR